MGSPEKNYSRNFQHVKDQFQNAAKSLFEKQHHDSKCDNAILSTIWFVGHLRGSDDEIHKSLWSRSLLKAKQLVLLYPCSADPNNTGGGLS